MPEPKPSAKSKALKIARFVLRWTIALVGIAFILYTIELHDQIAVLDANNLPVKTRLLAPAKEDSATFRGVDPVTGAIADLPRGRVINDPDRKADLDVITPPRGTFPIVGLRISPDRAGKPQTREILVEVLDPDGTKRGRWLKPADIDGGFELRTPQPLIEPGVKTMLRQADPWLLTLSIAIFPVTFLFTTIRWRRLLDALGIGMTLGKAAVLNFVGAFYNSFMPGSTGGDLLKAYYAAKHAPQRRTWAVMSVFVDRVLGLLTLILLGGTMAAVQYLLSDDKSDSTAMACRNVAVISALLLAGVLVGWYAMWHPGLRKSLGVNWLLRRIPMQNQVQKAVDVARAYKKRPALMLWAIVMTVPVHLTVTVSALLAGEAFKLPIAAGYYFVLVPVLVLVSALPLAPQGIGVMEGFAFLLTQKQGVTVGQAVALTMSIRLVQVIWNLVGGVFVLRGGYHAPSEQEQEAIASQPTPSSDLGLSPVVASAEG